MPGILATWRDFSGGHWGNVGPVNAPNNQWGGANMLLAPDGSITPVSASRYLTMNASPPGKMWGMFWAWGADGRIYWIQQQGTSTVTSNVYRFSPDVTSLPNTLSTCSTFTFVPTTEPDWVELGTTVYVTVYGNKTYTIDTSGNTMIILTGTYGNAPAGRCISLYKEFLMIGGISDARFGTHSNRIHFSGDITGNDTTARTAWEDLNYIDLGTDGDVITGLYQMRDFLVVVMDDQSIYLVTGTPALNLTARRITGFSSGSGGLTAFQPSHAAVDQSQTRIWMFDHATRHPARFNGANLTHVGMFGIPHASRTGTDLAEGPVTVIGGPDEILVHGVAVGRAAGEQIGSQSVDLVRVQNAWSAVLGDNLTLNPAAQPLWNLTPQADIWYRFQEPAGSTTIYDYGKVDGANFTTTNTSASFQIVAPNTTGTFQVTVGTTSGARAIKITPATSGWRGQADSAFGTTAFFVVADFYTPSDFSFAILNFRNENSSGVLQAGTITLSIGENTANVSIRNDAASLYLFASGGAGVSTTVGWHRALVTYDGVNILTFYWDGVQVGQDTTTTGTLTSAGTQWPVQVTGGRVAFQNVALGRRALTAGEVAYLASIPLTQNPSVPYVVSNDRYQVVACPDAGATTLAPILRYWYAAAPLWDADLAGDTANPPAYSFNEVGAPVYGSLELHALDLEASITSRTSRVISAYDAMIVGVLVEYVPLPVDLIESNVPSTTQVGFTVRAEGWGVPDYARVVTGSETSGVVVSSSYDFTTTIAAGNSDSWPNVRTIYCPLRIQGPVRNARVVLSNITGVRINMVHLLGSWLPVRET